MRTFITWFFLLALILIHSLDMELTRYYIGSDAKSEAFPPMSWCIGKFGIEMSLWISRAIMYPFFWLALVFRKKDGWLYFLILTTILYYTAMTSWIFHLGFWKWPLPPNLIPY